MLVPLRLQFGEQRSGRGPAAGSHLQATPTQASDELVGLLQQVTEENALAELRRVCTATVLERVQRHLWLPA